MIGLYEWPPSRSQRAKWALEELGLEYRSHITNLEQQQQDTDAYRAIHPLADYPVLTAYHQRLQQRPAYKRAYSF